jgi:hypothetical protein
MTTVNLHYHPAWVSLHATKLGMNTPLPLREAEDDDHTPYRHDWRVDFAPFPSQRHKTHNAKLILRSDDEKYWLYFVLEELPDRPGEWPREVFRKALDAVCDQEFEFSAGEIMNWQEHFKFDAKIHVVISAYKPTQ